MYNRLAEIAGEYLTKGGAVYIEGWLKTRKWQDRDTSADRYATEIIADQMQMLGARDDSGGSGTGYGYGAPTQRQPRPHRAPQQQRSAPTQTDSASSLADMDDDIPF